MSVEFFCGCESVLCDHEPGTPCNRIPTGRTKFRPHDWSPTVDICDICALNIGVLNAEEGMIVHSHELTVSEFIEAILPPTESELEEEYVQALMEAEPEFDEVDLSEV